ncbi:MAG: helix-turn-helix domain-containing protein [Stellaceae bacterium]
MSYDLLTEPARADAPAGRIIPTDPDALLFDIEAAYLLGQSKRTLADWRMTGGGPDFLRLGRQRSVRYRRRDLVAWMETRRRRSTSDPGPKG